MKNILVIWAWEWIWKNLIGQKNQFNNIYTFSRKNDSPYKWVKHIPWDVSGDIDFSGIDKQSLDIVVYIPSLRWTSSEMTTKEFDDYMKVWPRGLLNCFHSLKDWNYCNKDCLIVSIGSVASEMALSLWINSSSGIYSLSKLTQKSTLLQLSHIYKDCRYLNITLGSIGTEEDWGVWYENICNTISYANEMNTWVRYTEVTLVSRLDIS